MRFSTDGKFIYPQRAHPLGTTFAWDAQKGTAKTSPPNPPPSEQDKEGETFNSSAEILVHPNGKFVYSSNRGHDSVSVYRANPKSGKLRSSRSNPSLELSRNINLSPDATCCCGGSGLQTWPPTGSTPRPGNSFTNVARSSASPHPSVSSSPNSIRKTRLLGTTARAAGRPLK